MESSYKKLALLIIGGVAVIVVAALAVQNGYTFGLNKFFAAGDQLSAWCGGDVTPKIVLSWTSVADASAYIIQKKTDANLWRILDTTTETTFEDYDVIFGREYSYRVRGMLGTSKPIRGSVESLFSNVVTASCGTSTPPPGTSPTSTPSLSSTPTPTSTSTPTFTPTPAPVSMAITVNPTQQIRSVNRLALGGELYYEFMDEVNGTRGYPNAPYTWIDEMAVELKRSGVTILRYPGGSYSDVFNWYEGIGPLDKRVAVCRAHDFGYYHFGIAEFLNLAKKVGAQVIYTVNEDRAEPESIRRLAEYTNMPVTSDILRRARLGKWTVDMWRDDHLAVPKGYYAWLRTQPGYGNTAAANPGEPWKIAYWEIGNEVYAPYCEANMDGHPECDQREGCPTPPGIGRKQATVMAPINDGPLSPGLGVMLYISRLSAFSDAIRSVDSSAKIGATGYNYCPNCLWNKELLRNQTVASKFDFIIDHPYGPLATKPANWSVSEYSQAIVSVPYHEETYLLSGWASILGNKKLAVTEYNSDYGFLPDYGDYSVDLRGGLQNAGRMLMYLRSPNVLVATYHHMRMRGMFDWQGNPAIFGPAGLVLNLYTKYIKSSIVPSTITSNKTHSVRNIGITTGFDGLAIPDIDVLATASSNGRELTLFIINRNVKVAHTFELKTGSMRYSSMVKATVKTVYPEGSDEALLATNTVKAPNQVYVDTESMRTAPTSFSIAPATFMVITLSGGMPTP